MKTTIYELLGLIKDGKAPSDIEFNLEKYYMNCEGEYIRFDAYGNLIYLSKEYNILKCLNYEVVIIEEVENKEYEDIEEMSYKYVNTYGNISQHRKSEEPLIDTINALIRNQKYILERLDK